MASKNTLWNGKLGWGAGGTALGASVVSVLWATTGVRSPTPVRSPQPQTILPSFSSDSLAVEPINPPESSGLVSKQQEQVQQAPPEEVAVKVAAQEQEVSQPENEIAPPVPVAKPAGVRLININAAQAAELDLLPGIGPALARRIIDERTRGGRFTSLRDLQRVSGIGPRTAEKLEGLVTFE